MTHRINTHKRLNLLRIKNIKNGKKVLDIGLEADYIGLNNEGRGTKHNNKGDGKMSSKYEASIAEQDGSFYTMIIRVDKDGFEQVNGHYGARWFKTRKAAERSVEKYIAKMNA